jgi:hypothetical protein
MCMSILAVHKFDPSSESFDGACMLMIALLKNLPFILIIQRRSLIDVKFLTMWLNFDSTRKAVFINQSINQDKTSTEKIKSSNSALIVIKISF